jgi:hypothetical protein
VSKRKDRTVGRQLDERLGTMETKLNNLAAVIAEGHVPGDKDQALRVAELMNDVSAKLVKLGSTF